MMMMFAVGIAVMFGFWAVEWNREIEHTKKYAPVRGCATEGKACPEDLPVCLKHAELPTGVCTVECTRSSHCPAAWCCTALEGQSGPLRCLPRELCAAEERNKL